MSQRVRTISDPEWSFKVNVFNIILNVAILPVDDDKFQQLM